MINDLQAQSFNVFRSLAAVSAVAVLLAVQSGCGGPSGPSLVEASGQVNYDGKPVPNATVTFQPATGPIAIGKTDDSGKFSLTTNGEPGAVEGDFKVSISAYESSGSTADLKPEDMEKMYAEGTANQEPKSLIPEKYGKFETSGLSETVGPNAADNNFTFDLTD